MYMYIIKETILQHLPAGPAGPDGPEGPPGPRSPLDPGPPAGPEGPLGPDGPAPPLSPDGPGSPAGPAIHRSVSHPIHKGKKPRKIPTLKLAFKYKPFRLIWNIYLRVQMGLLVPKVLVAPGVLMSLLVQQVQVVLMVLPVHVALGHRWLQLSLLVQMGRVVLMVPLGLMGLKVQVILMDQVVLLVLAVHGILLGLLGPPVLGVQLHHVHRVPLVLLSPQLFLRVRRGLQVLQVLKVLTVHGDRLIPQHLFVHSLQQDRMVL